MEQGTNPTRSAPETGARPEKCKCPWRQKHGKKVHARLLGLETDVDSWHYMLDDGVSSAFSDGAAFIAAHSWSDQAKMREVRRSLEYMAAKLRDAELYRNPPKDEVVEQPDNLTESVERFVKRQQKEHAGLSITETRDRDYPHELSLEAHAERLQAIEDALAAASFLIQVPLGGQMTREYFQEVAGRPVQS